MLCCVAGGLLDPCGDGWLTPPSDSAACGKVRVFGISRPQIGPPELMSATLTACHATKRSSFGLLFAVLGSPCVQLADIEAARDCCLSTESCMDEKMNELANAYISNSPSTKERLYWTNALSLVSTMAHYCIMLKYDQLSGTLQMREPNHRSSIAPFLVPTSPRLSTLHESSRSLIATW